MPLRVIVMRGEAAKTEIRKQHFLAAVLGRPKLSAIMSLLFVCLSIPILLFILAYNYYMQSAAIMSTLRADVAKTKQASIENSENLIRPVESTLRLLAESAGSNATFFKTEQSRELLFRALTSAAQIDAVYVSFEDGYHRVVTRIDDDRRRSDPKIPVTANWHSSYIDEFSAGKNRARHRTFFDTWPHVVGQYDVATTMDVRVYPGWEEAKHTGALAVTRPAINPDTGYPIIFCDSPSYATANSSVVPAPTSPWISCPASSEAIGLVLIARQSSRIRPMGRLSLFPRSRVQFALSLAG
jgi:hypothetical protein